MNLCISFRTRFSRCQAEAEDLHLRDGFDQLYCNGSYGDAAGGARKDFHLDDGSR